MNSPIPTTGNNARLMDGKLYLAAKAALASHAAELPADLAAERVA